MNPPVSDKLGFVYIGDDPVAIFSEGRLGTNFQFGLYWPRHIYGRLVRELNAQGARAIGLDVMFGEGRLDHPPIYTTNGPVASDRFFEQQLQRAGNVVLAADKGVVPYPPFRRSARAIGDISIVRDSDGVLRRVRAFNDYRIWHPAIKQEARFNNWELGSALVRSNQIVFISPNGKKFVLALTEDGLFDPTQLNPVKPRRDHRSPIVQVRRAMLYSTASQGHLGEKGAFSW